jgi:hypothetical protein
MERWIPRLSALMTFLIFVWIIWGMNAEVATLKKERDEKITKVRTLEMLQAKLAMLKEKENKMKADLSLFPSSALLPVPFRKALAGIGRIVPENVTVTLLSIQSDKKLSDQNTSKEESSTNGEYELQMKGIAFGSDLHCLTALARLIEGLEKSSLFRNAKLVSADENKAYNHPGVGFEIVCDVQLESQKGGEGK